jgi:hypothetical protein
MQQSARETKAVALMLIIVTGYALATLATGRVVFSDFAELLGFYLDTALNITIVVGLVALATMMIRNRPSKQADPENAVMPLAIVKNWAVERWQRDGFLSLIWPPMLFAMLMTSFNSFKQMVLGREAFQYDALFAQWDRALFFGYDPWTVTHAIFSQPWMTAFMDAAYHAWFVPMTIGVVACAFMARSTFRVRTQYLLTYIGIWTVVGSLLAYLTPSAGPCFYNDFVGPNTSYAELMHRLGEISKLYGEDSLGFIMSQDHLRGARGAAELLPGGGISAMPSVHNALAVLFAIAGFRINRKLGWFMTAYAVLIWIASIHLGWHYALDGLVAWVATWVLWRGAGWVVDRLEKPAQVNAIPALA